MTEITFHFNAPDKAAYVARLARKALGTQVRLVISGAQTFGEISDSLWTVGSIDFLPHAVETDPEHVIQASAVLLAATCTTAAHRQVVLNVGASVLEGFSEFDRLIEIVTSDAEDRRLARVRWKYYSDRGYAVMAHDLASKGVA